MPPTLFCLSIVDTMTNPLVLFQQMSLGYLQLVIEKEQKRKDVLKAAYDRWAAKSLEMHSKTYMVKKKEFDILD